MQVNRRTFVGGAALSAGLASAARANTHKTGGGRAEAKALSKLEDYVEQHRADWGLPGMTVCMVNRDGFSGFVESGFADIDRKIPVGPDHLFQVGSITKMMTGLTAWSLIDEGKLSPDARLADLMPELVVRDGEAITLQHLLNHTSGLPRSAPMLIDGGLWTGTEPGAHWAYSNLGYRIAGLIIERADGRLYQDAVEARLLKPLGMMQSKGSMRAEDRRLYATGYEPALMDRPAKRPGPMNEAPWVDFDAGSGCVAATAGDMALFLKFLLGLADGKGGPVFSDETAARFLANPADAPGWSKGTRYGNGLAHIESDGRAYLHHTGGMVSFSSALHVDPEAGVAAFASTNVHYAHKYRPRAVTIHACELLREGAEEAPEPKPTKPTVEKPAPYAGVYTAENGDSFEIVTGEDSVSLLRDGSETAMQPVGGGYFYCEDEAFAVTGLHFDLEEEKAARVWAGNVEYAVDPSKGYLPKVLALEALEGRYDSDDRWSLPVRVYARGDKLCVASANFVSTLKQLDNGDWRAEGEETEREWIRFDNVMDGKARRVLWSGEISLRRFS